MSTPRALILSLTIGALAVACSKKESASGTGGAGTAKAAPVPADAPSSEPASRPKPRAEPNFENPTDLTGLTARGECDNTKPCVCVGVVGFGDTALEKIGVTAAHLTEGTACVFGDFDGNGFLDAAILGVEHGEVVEGQAKKASGQVLMFDAVGLRLVAALPAQVLSLARRAKVKMGEKTLDALYDPAGDTSVEFVLADERFGVRKASGQ